MALGFGSSKDEDVIGLIARKNYAKAIEVLKGQLQRGKADPRVRMQLADVLVMAKKDREAVAILVPLADEYAREGFAAKAISVLKKIQKIDPGRRDIEQKLASMIQEKQRMATVSIAPSSGALPEIGMEEIGMELPSFPSHGARERIPIPVPETIPIPREPAAPEIGLGLDSDVSLALPSPAREPEPLQLTGEPLELAEVSVEPPRTPAPTAPPVVEALPAADASPKASAVVDSDFFTEADLQLVEPEALMVDATVVEAEPLIEAQIAPEAPADPMTDARFADELMGLVDQLFEATPSPAEGRGAGTMPPPETGQQIVVSPLFKDFSVDEMVAVIAGLQLLTFARGDVVIRQGEPGHSLYMLTSGKVRAFVKSAGGKNVPVADLSEGAFFGEHSILTGQPRNATVAALTRCEMLELDSTSLDDITARFPHVMDVLKEFAEKRRR